MVGTGVRSPARAGDSLRIRTTRSVRPPSANRSSPSASRSAVRRACELSRSAPGGVFGCRSPGGGPVRAALASSAPVLWQYEHFYVISRERSEREPNREADSDAGGRAVRQGQAPCGEGGGRVRRGDGGGGERARRRPGRGWSGGHGGRV